MKRVNLLLIILLVLSTATIILHAGSGPVNVDKTIVGKSHTPVSVTSPPRPNPLAKLVAAPTTVATSTLPQAPVTPTITETVIPAPVASLRNFIDPTTQMEFLPVSGGCFQMGDNAGDTDEKPAHQACLDDYYIGKFEVTQGQWQLVMGTRPSFFNSCGDNCPVESISWNDAQDFISKVNNMNGRTYRLLTEAEWEYACRSGGKAERYCGGDIVDAAAWFDKNSSSRPHPVGEKRANGLGIYDMSGNVWEWVSDRFQKDYYNNTPTHNPEGPLTGSKRVIRGGSWYNDPRNVRSAIRGCDEPDHRSINLGFRLACSTR